MTANVWKSLTMRIMVPGHPPREAERTAAGIVIDCLVIYTIMGYRSGNAERERSPAVYSGAETRSMILAGDCGTIPAGADRNGMLLPGMLNPARTDGRGEYAGTAEIWRISSASCGTTGMVCW